MKLKSSMDFPLKDDSFSLNILKFWYFNRSLIFYHKIEVMNRFKKQLRHV